MKPSSSARGFTILQESHYSGTSHPVRIVTTELVQRLHQGYAFFNTLNYQTIRQLSAYLRSFKQHGSSSHTAVQMFFQGKECLTKGQRVIGSFEGGRATEFVWQEIRCDAGNHTTTMTIKNAEEGEASAEVPPKKR
eukprot:CAMPEP_0194511748 /NCGR_PEP_ID=MMETSP0253-20130528/43482_1 /TAXON_ID=2966 /ORGANISM="Noctiluca scintillans" /LENGTH=135 /DNA_ID=CAMNT_0039355107 /DNA_START=639 /DNA_END=1046 /DNA_ORIENTATION=+